MEKNIEKYLLSLRIRQVDRNLLNALCIREAINQSEAIRRAIVNEAELHNLYCIAGLVVNKDNAYE